MEIHLPSLSVGLCGQQGSGRRQPNKLPATGGWATGNGPCGGGWSAGFFHIREPQSHPTVLLVLFQAPAGQRPWLRASCRVHHLKPPWGTLAVHQQCVPFPAAPRSHRQDAEAGLQVETAPQPAARRLLTTAAPSETRNQHVLTSGRWNCAPQVEPELFTPTARARVACQGFHCGPLRVHPRRSRPRRKPGPCSFFSCLFWPNGRHSSTSVRFL